MINEDYLQEQAELGKNDGSVDSLAYEKLFAALQKDTIPMLPPYFADTVTAKVGEKRSSATSALTVGLAVMAGLFSIVILALAVMLTGFKVELGFLEPLREFRGILFFGVTLILLLNFVDRYLVRRIGSPGDRNISHSR